MAEKRRRPGRPRTRDDQNTRAVRCFVQNDLYELLERVANERYGTVSGVAAEALADARTNLEMRLQSQRIPLVQFVGHAAIEGLRGEVPDQMLVDLEAAAERFYSIPSSQWNVEILAEIENYKQEHKKDTHAEFERRFKFVMGILRVAMTRSVTLN